jgi:hypothetical protein
MPLVSCRQRVPSGLKGSELKFAFFVGIYLSGNALFEGTLFHS